MDITDLKLVQPELIPLGENHDDPIELLKLSIVMQQICEKERGIGLSAVQVGVPWNFFIVKFPLEYRYFVNCSYKPRSEQKQKGVEGCLSLRNADKSLKFYEVERHAEIIVEGKELFGEPTPHLKNISLLPDQLYAPIYKIVFQHEIDHSQGITIDKIGKEVSLWSQK